MGVACFGKATRIVFSSASLLSASLPLATSRIDFFRIPPVLLPRPVGLILGFQVEVHDFAGGLFGFMQGNGIIVEEVRFAVPHLEFAG